MWVVVRFNLLIGLEDGILSHQNQYIYTIIYIRIYNIVSMYAIMYTTFRIMFGRSSHHIMWFCLKIDFFPIAKSMVFCHMGMGQN